MTHSTRSKLKSIAALAASISLITAVGQSAQAADWIYQADANNDAYGGNPFEIYGMGIKDDGDNVWVGINAGLGIGGHNMATQYNGDGDYIEDQNVGWGDLFLDFDPFRNFADASRAGTLIGIHFASGNDSAINGGAQADWNEQGGSSPVGVYSHVRGADVQRQNGGFRNFGANKQFVNSLHGEHITPTIGGRAFNDGYYGEYAGSETNDFISNTIGSGHFLGGLDMLSSQDLLTQGFNTGVFGQNPTQSFGFKFQRSLLPDGGFIASLFEECLNDAISLDGYFAPPPTIITGDPIVDDEPEVTIITGDPIVDDEPEVTIITGDPITTILDDSQDVPEPASILALAFAGIVGLLSKRRDNSQTAAE